MSKRTARVDHEAPPEYEFAGRWQLKLKGRCLAHIHSRPPSYMGTAIPFWAPSFRVTGLLQELQPPPLLPLALPLLLQGVNQF